MQPPIPKAFEARTQINTDKFSQPHPERRVSMGIGHDAPDRHDGLAECALNCRTILSAGDSDRLIIGNAVAREGMNVSRGAQGSALGVRPGEPEMAATVDAHRICGAVTCISPVGG